MLWCVGDGFINKQFLWYGDFVYVVFNFLQVVFGEGVFLCSGFDVIVQFVQIGGDVCFILIEELDYLWVSILFVKVVLNGVFNDVMDFFQVFCCMFF